jgi:hypothetical protein
MRTTHNWLHIAAWQIKAYLSKSEYSADGDTCMGSARTSQATTGASKTLSCTAHLRFTNVGCALSIQKQDSVTGNFVQFLRNWQVCQASMCRVQHMAAVGSICAQLRPPRMKHVLRNQALARGKRGTRTWLKRPCHLSTPL